MRELLYDIQERFAKIETGEKYIEDTLIKCCEQINRLREDTAKQYAQINDLEKTIIKLEEIVDTYRGRIDMNCEFIEKYGYNFETIHHDIETLKTIVALNATRSEYAMMYPTVSNNNDVGNNESDIESTKSVLTTLHNEHLEKTGSACRSVLKCIADVIIKIGAVIISIASFFVGFFK